MMKWSNSNSHSIEPIGGEHEYIVGLTTFERYPFLCGFLHRIILVWSWCSDSYQLFSTQHKKLSIRVSSLGRIPNAYLGMLVFIIFLSA